MISTQSGSIRLFRVAGIQVYLHWSWFIIAFVELAYRRNQYSTIMWNIAEYLSLFLIVLLHEFGHALACRQTGGTANEIILWPLGGIAFVNPPMRPGAVLWSIAAGPLVNVLLYPLLMAAMWLADDLGWIEGNRDFARFLFMVFWINRSLLVFNLLPIYPLDGGQIVQSLLWFKLGRARSLYVASVVGLATLAAIGIWAVLTLGVERVLQDYLWTCLIALFIGQRCFAGLKAAQGLQQLERVPRHRGFACPSCHQAPPGGPMWRCESCGHGFDPFSTNAVCPHCQARQSATMCAYCGTASPIERWSMAHGGAGQPPIIIDV
ncbi:MAG: site-2 protease family protein [Opitutaceae bacterium]|nr:site-2 protease family protein [Opitutaceae bacterium]